jgi:hypothetical protein
MADVRELVANASYFTDKSLTLEDAVTKVAAHLIPEPWTAHLPKPEPPETPKTCGQCKAFLTMGCMADDVEHDSRACDEFEPPEEP